VQGCCTADQGSAPAAASGRTVVWFAHGLGIWHLAFGNDQVQILLFALRFGKFF
jgi:hypothetical protein